MIELIAFIPAAFLGGVLSFLSPCVLPLVPGYLCFAAGLHYKDMTALAEEGKATRRILPPALAFVAGFSCVFIALGAGAAAINPLLLAHQLILAQIAGGLIILFGLYMVGVLPLARLLPVLTSDKRFFIESERKNASILAAFIMGLAFAFGWTPCIGPILASILALAATREALSEGVILLGFYAAGLGVPFILAALGVGKYMHISKSLKKYGGHITKAAGILLIITGVLVLNGRLQSLGIYLLDYFPILATLG